MSETSTAAATGAAGFVGACWTSFGLAQLPTESTSHFLFSAQKKDMMLVGDENECRNLRWWMYHESWCICICDRYLWNISVTSMAGLDFWDHHIELKHASLDNWIIAACGQFMIIYDNFRYFRYFRSQEDFLQTSFQPPTTVFSFTPAQH